MFDPCEMATIAERYLKDPDAALALVTLVEKTGSSYRQPGARMLVLKDRSTMGSISGGCLEGDLANLAIEMARDGQETSLKTIDTRPIFGCQGTITLFIELIPPKKDEMDRLMWIINEAIEGRKTFQLRTVYKNSEALGTRIAGGESPRKNESGHEFHQSFGLKKRLVLVGAHQDVESIVQSARLLEWQCLQVVPGAQRSGWVASSQDGEVLYLDAAHVCTRIQPDEATAVVIMTHNLGRDLDYAQALLPKAFGYIGMLGSKKRREELMNHLMELGSEELIMATERLHCPIGLNIGSETQQEIALSIVSEVQAVFAGRAGGKLKDVSQPIHPKS